MKNLQTYLNDLSTSKIQELLVLSKQRDIEDEQKQKAWVEKNKVEVANLYKTKETSSLKLESLKAQLRDESISVKKNKELSNEIYHLKNSIDKIELSLKELTDYKTHERMKSYSLYDY